MAELVQVKGGGTLDTQTLALSLGLSVKSSSFVDRVSAAKHFGLLESKDGNIVATALAKKIIRPISSEEQTAGLQEAFRKFGVFDKLCERYKGEKLPEAPLLQNILHREHHVSDTSKGLAYRVFVESGKLASLIKETEEGLTCGELEPWHLGTGLPISPEKPALNSDLAALLQSIGALRALQELQGKVSDASTNSTIEAEFRRVLELAMQCATKLNMPASKVTLKIVSDRLASHSFSDAITYFTYVGQALIEDLKLGESIRERENPSAKTS